MPASKPDFFYYERAIAPHQCTYFLENGKCQLKQQAKLRKIPDFLNSVDDGKCIFLSPAKKLSRSCPEFVQTPILAGSEKVKKQLPKDRSDHDRYVLKGKYIPINHPLQKDIDDPIKNTYYHCAEQGLIHESFCEICPTHLSDAFTARRPKQDRTPDSCRRNVFGCGKIHNGQTLWLEQYQFDLEVFQHNRQHSQYDWNFVKMPAEPTNWLHRYSKPHEYKQEDKGVCRRCGPEKSGKVHLCCYDGCGTRNLCEKCINDPNWIRQNNGSVEVSFTCPDCGTSSAPFNFGTHGTNASIHANGKASREFLMLATKPSPFVPVDFANLMDTIASGSSYEDRLRMSNFSDQSEISAILNNDSISMSRYFLEQPPLLEPKATVIKEGLSRGLYLYSLGEKRAYIFVPDLGDWPPLQLLDAAKGDYFDCTISYGMGDTAMAIRLQTHLENLGLRVFLINVKDNQGDPLWGLRFKEALFYSNHFIPLLSKDYIQRPGSAMELYEALKIHLGHFDSDSTFLHFILPVLLEKEVLQSIKNATSKWLRSEIPFSNEEKEGEERKHRFHRDAFNWALVPFFLDFESLGLSKGVEAIELFLLYSVYPGLKGAGLQHLANLFLGICNLPAIGTALVFSSIDDDDLVHLVTLSPQKKRFRYFNTVSINNFDITPCPLEEALNKF